MGFTDEQVRSAESRFADVNTAVEWLLQAGAGSDDDDLLDGIPELEDAEEMMDALPPAFSPVRRSAMSTESAKQAEQAALAATIDNAFDYGMRSSSPHAGQLDELVSVELEEDMGPRNEQPYQPSEDNTNSSRDGAVRSAKDYLPLPLADSGSTFCNCLVHLLFSLPKARYLILSLPVTTIAQTSVLPCIRHMQLLFGRLQLSTYDKTVTSDDTQVDARGVVDSMHRVRDFRNDFESPLNVLVDEFSSRVSNGFQQELTLTNNYAGTDCDQMSKCLSYGPELLHELFTFECATYNFAVNNDQEVDLGEPLSSSRYRSLTAGLYHPIEYSLDQQFQARPNKTDPKRVTQNCITELPRVLGIELNSEIRPVHWTSATLYQPIPDYIYLDKYLKENIHEARERFQRIEDLRSQQTHLQQNNKSLLGDLTTAQILQETAEFLRGSDLPEDQTCAEVLELLHDEEVQQEKLNAKEEASWRMAIEMMWEDMRDYAFRLKAIVMKDTDFLLFYIYIFDPQQNQWYKSDMGGVDWVSNSQMAQILGGRAENTPTFLFYTDERDEELQNECLSPEECFNLLPLGLRNMVLWGPSPTWTSHSNTAMTVYEPKARREPLPKIQYFDGMDDDFDEDWMGDVPPPKALVRQIEDQTEQRVRETMDDFDDSEGIPKPILKHFGTFLLGLDRMDLLRHYCCDLAYNSLSVSNNGPLHRNIPLCEALPFYQASHVSLLAVYRTAYDKAVEVLCYLVGGLLAFHSGRMQAAIEEFQRALNADGMIHISGASRRSEIMSLLMTVCRKATFRAQRLMEDGRDEEGIHLGTVATQVGANLPDTAIAGGLKAIWDKFDLTTNTILSSACLEFIHRVRYNNILPQKVLMHAPTVSRDNIWDFYLQCRMNS